MRSNARPWRWSAVQPSPSVSSVIRTLTRNGHVGSIPTPWQRDGGRRTCAGAIVCAKGLRQRVARLDRVLLRQPGSSPWRTPARYRSERVWSRGSGAGGSHCDRYVGGSFLCRQDGSQFAAEAGGNSGGMRRRLLGGQSEGLFHKRLGVLQSEGQSAHAIRAGLIGSIDQKADLRKVCSGDANGTAWRVPVYPFVGHKGCSQQQSVNAARLLRTYRSGRV